ncbi:MAG TPA: polyprenol monophosphomannose synthase [Planctomycetaceae bacterium]|nr:polyprenol monophosphomannose synthase [Planctomycetaceae bacterium]
MTAERLLVTLCTYNEAENLVPLVKALRQIAPAADVLVIDDASPDGTGRLADELAAADPQVHVIHRSGKLGLGTATLAGFQYALDQGFDFLINLDADFSHPPEVVPKLLEMMSTADVAIGSRYVRGGKIHGWKLSRHVMSRLINWYSRLLLRLPVRDASGSFRCYRLAKVRQLNLGLVRARGYAFQEEILYRCRRVGCRFAETPITFENRRLGTSKIKLREGFVAGWVILRLAWDSLVGKSV